MVTTEISQIKSLVDKVEGWLTDEEGELLYSLAKGCTGRGVIVEVGSWKGRSTIWLGKGSKIGNRLKIYAIDPHTGSSEHKVALGEVWTFEEFRKNIGSAQIDDTVIPIVKASAEAALDFKEPVEFIFIDGAHEYDMVKLDFELWFPKVVEGGYMAFHDTTVGPGPGKLVEESLFKSRCFRNVRFAGSITYGQKVSQNTLKDRLRNRFNLRMKQLYEYASKLHLPMPLRVLGKKIKAGLS